ncbi:MAG: hypothetical protein ABW221_20085 [Vicinamibacteria bacterium]
MSTAVTNVLAVVILAAILAACGGGSTPLETRATLGPQAFHALEPDQVAFAEITVDVDGVLTARADWRLAGNDLDLYVTAPSCAAWNVVDLAARCAVLGRTTGVTAKPERLAIDVTRGTYRVWVANFGRSVESGTLEATAAAARDD